MGAWQHRRRLLLARLHFFVGEDSCGFPSCELRSRRSLVVSSTKEDVWYDLKLPDVCKRSVDEEP